MTLRIYPVTHLTFPNRSLMMRVIHQDYPQRNGLEKENHDLSAVVEMNLSGFDLLAKKA